MCSLTMSWLLVWLWGLMGSVPGKAGSMVSTSTFTVSGVSLSSELFSCFLDRTPFL